MKTYLLLPIISFVAIFTSQSTLARHHSSSSSSSSSSDAINDDHGPPCTSADCENRGQCIGTTNNPKCYCIVGFKGRRCQHLARPGSSYSNNARNSPSFGNSNSQNGGRGFVNGAGPGCPPSYCNNHGLCAVGNGVYVCQCAGGYTGSRCENVSTSTSNNPAQQASVLQTPQTFSQVQNLAQSQQSVPQTQQIYPQTQNRAQQATQQGQSVYPQTQNLQNQQTPQLQNLPQTQGVNQLQTFPQSQLINQGQRIPQAQTMYQVLPANQQTNQAVSNPQYIQVLQPSNQPNRQINLSSLVAASLPAANQNTALLQPAYSTQPLAAYPAYAPINGISNTPGLTNAIQAVYAGKK